MPAKKNSPEGEYSSAISRFLPNSEDDASSFKSDSTNETKREGEIVLNADRKEVESRDRADQSSSEQKDERRGAEGVSREVDNTDSLSQQQTSKGAPAPQERKKIRLTAPYVDEAINHVFENSWLRLRRMTGEKVSQSEVIEAALAIVCDQFDRKGEESDLFKAILSIRDDS